MWIQLDQTAGDVVAARVIGQCSSDISGIATTERDQPERAGGARIERHADRIDDVVEPARQIARRIVIPTGATPSSPVPPSENYPNRIR